MRWGPLLLCGWPGLARLWFRGHLSSLAVAIGFSVLLNLALVSTFLWPWSLGETFPLVAWPMIALVWIASASATYRTLPDLMTAPGQPQAAAEPTTDALFIQAQQEYLKGHWKETESLLIKRLDSLPRDIEARLLLATAFRHQRKLDQACEQLDFIQRFDESTHWQFEIERELELIKLITEHDSDQVDDRVETMVDQEVERSNRILSDEQITIKPDNNGIVAENTNQITSRAG